MSTSLPPTIDETLFEAANKTLALYYHLFFTRHQRLSSRPEHFVMAFMELLPQRSLAITRETGHPAVHLLVEDDIALRILMTRWIPRQEEQRLQRLMEKYGWPIGLLLNFGAPTPQLRRFFLSSP